MNDHIENVLSKLGGGVSGTFNSVLDKLNVGVTEVDVAAERQKRRETEVMPLLDAIAYNETRGVEGDPHAFRQPSGNKKLGDAIGKWQVTAGELKNYSKEFMGREIDPEDFAKSPELQKEYMAAKIEALQKAGASPEEIFALHRGGLTGYADPEKRKKKVEQRKGYVAAAAAYLADPDRAQEVAVQEEKSKEEKKKRIGVLQQLNAMLDEVLK